MKSTLYQDMAARLIAQEKRRDNSEAEAALAITNALTRAAIEMSRWMGPAGCTALLSRALQQTRASYPALADLQVVSNSAPTVVGAAQSIRTYDPREVAVGLEATLVHFFELVGRLIGDDLTLKLTNQIKSDDVSLPARRAEPEEQTNG